MEKKQISALETFYSNLFSSGFFVIDEKEPYFPEKLLQIIWNEQILTKALSTACGEKLEIVHQGTWNVESGPDFRDAVIAINGKIRYGDVEIHFHPEDWNKHGHQLNSDYDQVILHCVWQGDRKSCTEYPSGVPLFILSNFLAVSIKQIISQVNFDTYTYARKVSPCQEAAWISRLENGRLSELLQSHGITRILQKANNYTHDIEKYGIDNAAYRALFDVMGYKNNRKPFRELSLMVPLEELSSYPSKEAIAVLFGNAGLLPDPSYADIHLEYIDWVQEMWSVWWSKRKRYQPIQWKKNKFRPFNSPERRLLAGYLVLNKNSFRLGGAIIETLLEHKAPEKGLKKVQQVFEIKPESKFLRFLTFSRVLDKPIALLGKDRINDLVANFAIPFFFAYCLLNGSTEQCLKGKSILIKIPCLQDNRLLKEAVHRFLVPPSRSKEVITNACAQQGMLFLYNSTLKNQARKN